MLILDEPSNGLDPIAQLDMRRLIRDLGGVGETIVLSSHDMDELGQLRGHVGIVGGGKILAEGIPEQRRGRAMAAGEARQRGDLAA